MWNLFVKLDDSLIGLAGKAQKKLCAAFTTTPQRLRAVISIVVMTISLASGIVGLFRLSDQGNSSTFTIWVVAYVLWLTLAVVAMITGVYRLRTAPVWTAAEYRKSLVGSVMVRANDAPSRLINLIVIALMIFISIVGFTFDRGHGPFFVAMMTLFMSSKAINDILTSAEVPPLPGNLRHSAGC
jgi:hypothetical protein